MDHTEVFYRLGARNNLPNTKHQQISIFVHGLHDEINDKLYPLTFLSDAISLASKIEESDGIKKTKTYQRKNNWDKQQQRTNPTDSIEIFNKEAHAHLHGPSRRMTFHPKFQPKNQVKTLEKRKLTSIIVLLWENVSGVINKDISPTSAYKEEL